MPAKILVVQGEEEIREFVSEAFQQAGYAVVAPVDSYVALEMAQESEFDLVALSDQLPIIDGPAFLRLLKERQPHIPALLLYHQLSKQGRENFETLSVQAFLQMPFRIEDMLTTVEELVRF